MYCARQGAVIDEIHHRDPYKKFGGLCPGYIEVGVPSKNSNSIHVAVDSLISIKWKHRCPQKMPQTINVTLYIIVSATVLEFHLE